MSGKCLLLSIMILNALISNEFKDLGAECKVQGAWCKVHGARCRVQGVEYKALSAKSRVQIAE